MQELTEMQKLYLEQRVYRLADDQLVGYIGGTWTFKDGLWQMNTDLPQLLRSTYGEWGVTPLAASYGLNIFACNRLCWHRWQNDAFRESKFWAAHQYALRDAMLDRADILEADKASILQYLD